MKKRLAAFSEWADMRAPAVFILPAIMVILMLAIFPLIVSLYLSLSRFKFIKGGFSLKFIGLLNYKKLLVGSQQFHFLGVFGKLTVLEIGILILAAVLLIVWLVRYFRSGRLSIIGVLGRLLLTTGVLALAWLILLTINQNGYPGTLVVTIFYVVFGVLIQFLIGLGLALLCAQRIPGRNFFRLVFFFPLMVTPVGIAYTFRMLVDTTIGPFTPIWEFFGWGAIPWVTIPWAARWVILLGDTWQWTPFMFIVLLAALENQPRDQVEAAIVDGASGWQIFRDITWPAIIPVCVTLILIRLIEAFKIIDLPNVLTNGGPGIASESLTLHSFMAWRTLDLGGSAAVAYMLLFISVFFAMSFVNFASHRLKDA
ncbi:MAG: sugar ABC transporter permease [Desulfobacterales bacterium]|nr:sugar ABC transporter permease [Desulfobacterales bacterium]